MGTRCVVTFVEESFGECREFSVFKHWDGYPSNMIPLIQKSLDKAWKLPRYEADEFACAFIATAKDSSGDVRLTTSPDAHGDLDYTYRVFMHNNKLHVSCRDVYTETLVVFQPITEPYVETVE